MDSTHTIRDFDDVFKYIGGWGPFQVVGSTCKPVTQKCMVQANYPFNLQYVITFAFFPFNFFLGYIYLSPILTTFPPPHW